MTSKIDLDLQRLCIAVPAFHDPTKPLPLLIKANPEDPNCWSTGDGNRVFATPEAAAAAMSKPSEADMEVSFKRLDLQRLVSATVVPEDDCMVTLGDDGYYTDVAEMLERLGDDVVVDGEPNLPAWCFATTRQNFDFDLFNSIESHMDDNHHEDSYGELKGLEELETFWEAWVAKQTVSSYFIDYQRIIVIDQTRYERELAEAKAWLEANAHG